MTTPPLSIFIIARNEADRIGDAIRAVRDLTDDLVKNSDCVIICTEHSNIDYHRICEHAPLIVDTRNALSTDIRNGSKAKIVRL